MSGVVRIEIRKTTEELKTLMRKEKDVLCHEKLQVLYWFKTQTIIQNITNTKGAKSPTKQFGGPFRSEHKIRRDETTASGPKVCMYLRPWRHSRCDE